MDPLDAATEAFRSDPDMPLDELNTRLLLALVDEVRSLRARLDERFPAETGS